ncbi:LVIVD repeat-containing protein [Paracraurococcus ruber]|uniref:LVIVD repeat-containing protein n=1 Tax=Paracraurococcus ruber TaxID=77675 RepID=A0ABS1D6R7_9PROT|nr:hypothetical protein [Paracraurococcus ruber]MBK1662266.1 hypothetical protein [Paracraurococcus ruber]TDG30255.1 hypothetical protein E2C05_15020 [Paracraurococcus ruber]
MTGSRAPALLLALAALAAPPAAAQPAAPAGPEASNMRLLGQHDLQARSAYQPTIQQQGDRWILYVGHHGGTQAEPKPLNPITGQREFNGTSILDVTDPAKPAYLAHIPGEEGLDEDGGAQMVRVCPGTALRAGRRDAFYLLRTQGNAGHQVFDVTDPAKPALLARIPAGHTHKNWWECDTGIAYLVSGNQPPWKVRRMTQVFDLNDPANPRHIRDFGLPGQQMQEGEAPTAQHGEHGAIPTELHGGISTGPQGNRIYFGYGTNSGGIVQIIDRSKLIEGPAAPTDANLRAPEVGRLVMMPWVGAHTAYPLLRMPIAELAKDGRGAVRDFVMIVDESLRNECRDEARQMVWFADITVESQPMVVSHWTVPEASGDFCTRGGRFGAHSSNESMAPVFHRKLAFIAFFNAGVRALDIRNPYQPREVGHFIPAITDRTAPRCVTVEGQPRCKRAIQTNNVETDARGLVYIVDRANTGVHILEVTGEPLAISRQPAP